MKTPRSTPLSTPDGFPEVNFSDFDGVRSLHLGTPWIQGTMILDDPYAIELEYVQRMMAWLLFSPLEKVSKLHAMQLGLGAGTLTKYCRKRLKMTVTAIELNPQVVHACRGWFKLPPDDSRQRIVIADAGQEIQNPMWHGAVDALQVDLYDDQAAGPVLDSATFYADCRQLLSDEACMTVNLFGHRSCFDASVEKIANAFGRDAIWLFKPTREGNTIVLAQKTASRPGRERLETQALWIQEKWGLPAKKWLRTFKPLEKNISL